MNNDDDSYERMEAAEMAEDRAREDLEAAVKAERERVLGEVEALIRASPAFRITLNDFMYWRHEYSK